MKVYSKLDLIPKGTSENKLTEGCLVLEGGAFRGLYTQGVLDAFMMNGINLSCVIGTSAGALAGMNYCSGQIGRSARANLHYRHDSEFIGTKAIRKSHSAIRLDFLLNDYNQIEALDYERFYNPEQRMVAAATDCNTGETRYFEKGHCSNIMDAIKASASMPYVSAMVNVDGIPCLDGGCSCKIPYQWAVDEGYEKIVVIKTREDGFRKPEGTKDIAQKIYRKHPEFAKKLDDSNNAYNRQCDELEQLSRDGRIYLISPELPVTVGRVEGNMEKLGSLYWQGYDDGMKHLESLRKYLGI